MIGVAYAMGQTGAQTAQQGGAFMQMVPLILMFVIFYFLLIRPQQKKAKEHRQMIDDLKKGDRIITTGGIYGTITSLDETTLTVEIADKIRIKLVRGNVAGLAGKPAAEKKDK